MYQMHMDSSKLGKVQNAHQTERIIRAVKHGAGSIMIWKLIRVGGKTLMQDICVMFQTQTASRNLRAADHTSTVTHHPHCKT